MSTPHRLHPWKRLWYSQARPATPEVGGFTVVRDYERWAPDGPRLLTFEEIAHVPALVFLGDGGAGKTISLRQEVERLRAQLAGSQDLVLSFDLSEFQSSTDLVDGVFRHPEVGRWMNGTGTLHLFLDAFDEGTIRLHSLAAVLRRELAKLDCLRLAVRLASRPALWPQELEQGLTELFGKGRVGVYILAPLQEEDTALAAREAGHDAAQFLAAVRRLNVGPLAAKPVTLHMLLREFSQAGGDLPGTQTDLYLKGSLSLCDEWRPSRRYPSERARRLGIESTLHVAAAIAAVSVLSGRPRIWTERDHGEAGDGHVTVPELCVSLDGGGSLVEAEIWETLECGLFTGLGEHALQFTHRTFAEFLTAYHLHRNGISGLRLEELLTVAVDGDRWLVPHLTETAAWLEALAPSSVTSLLERVPEEWVQSAADIPAELRERAAAALLRVFESGEVYDEIDIRLSYAKICHSGLAEQVRPILADSERHPIARRAAASISGECGLQSLQGELLEMALNKGAPGTIRQNAIRALAVVGEDATIARLRPLALESVEEDRDDETKGAALSAVWPRHATVDEVLAAFTPRKDSGLTGGYVMFAVGGFAAAMSAEQVVTALRWLSAAPAKLLRPSIHADVARSVIRTSFAHLEKPQVRAAAAEVAVIMLRQREPLIGERLPMLADATDLPPTDHLRRLLVSDIVSRAPEFNGAYGLVTRHNRLVFQADREWLEEQAASQPEAAWKGLINRLASEAEAKHES